MSVGTSTEYLLRRGTSAVGPEGFVRDPSNPAAFVKPLDETLILRMRISELESKINTLTDIVQRLLEANVQNTGY